MSQTSIDTFFKTRKRPASELIPSGKSITRKLFAQDEGPSSPIRSPVRHVVIRESKDIEDASCEPKSPHSALVSSEEQSEDTGSREEPDKNSVEKPEASTPQRSIAEQKRLQKELNLGEFKKVVCRSKRFSTLKAALEKHNATVSRLKTIEDSRKNLTNSPELKQFSNIEFEVNCSPRKQGNLKPRKLFGNDTSRSPVKNQSYISPRKLLDEGPSPVKLPVQEQYNHLLADGKNALVLPPKYATLKELFNGVETVVRIMMSRKEMVTFKRIRGDVQKMTRRNFSEQHLGMIKTIYPDAYNLKYEFIKLPFTRDETLELVIEISASHSLDITERKRMFHKLLLDQTKLHHQVFLKTLDPPLTVNIDHIRRWHPLHDLNTVPDIQVAVIPRPTANKEAPVLVKDFLEETKKLVSCNKRVERAVSQLIAEKSTTEGDRKTEKTSISSPVLDPIPAFRKALKGVPQSLLEKIRAKKVAKMFQAITQTPEEAKEQAMKSRLPELAKSLRYVFVSEKKNSLPLTKVSERFKDKMSTAELVEHLELISKAVPGWLTIFTNLERNEQYVRLSKDADISRIVGKLKTLAEAS